MYKYTTCNIISMRVFIALKSRLEKRSEPYAEWREPWQGRDSTIITLK